MRPAYLCAASPAAEKEPVTFENDIIFHALCAYGKLKQDTPLDPKRFSTLEDQLLEEALENPIQFSEKLNSAYQHSLKNTKPVYDQLPPLE